ncbi:hypothetical protein [Cupriavidus necator]|uniref:hypothetical protein n=1 Tax=Cupriavidus necator TaxID=106590 RepID=UPI00339D7E2B
MQRGREPLRPRVQLGGIVALEHILVLRARLAGADVDVLRRAQEELDAGHCRQLGQQPVDQRAGGDVAVGAVLQHDPEAAVGKRLAAAGYADRMVDQCCCQATARGRKTCST